MKKANLYVLWNKYAKYFIMVLSLCMICIGVGRGEAEVVLKKAVNICLECIGIG
ncbi:MAG: CD1871A family CXXC motif-containing protein [Clostridiales bacterium]|nr:CD1871A family CXXC motif-containing protein [Clostridiales bacterium]